MYQWCICKWIKFQQHPNKVYNETMRILCNSIWRRKKEIKIVTHHKMIIFWPIFAYKNHHKRVNLCTTAIIVAFSIHYSNEIKFQSTDCKSKQKIASGTIWKFSVYFYFLGYTYLSILYPFDWKKTTLWMNTSVYGKQSKIAIFWKCSIV